LPSGVAVIVTAPRLTTIAILPEIVMIELLELVKFTGNLDDTSALRIKGAELNFLEGIASNRMD
jgi:hypothetical protein